MDEFDAGLDPLLADLASYVANQRIQREQAFETYTIANVSDIAAGAKNALIFVRHRKIERLASVDDMQTAHAAFYAHPIESLHHQHRIGQAHDRHWRDDQP